MERASQRLLALVVAACAGLFAQAQFSDDFNDQDLTNGPVWTGSSVFITNTSGQLQLNDAVAASSYLQSDLTLITLDDVEWHMQVKQTFSPSSSNFGRVYLASDQADLLGPLNGYYLQFGEAGSLDAIELFEQSGTTSTSVCRGTDAQIANSFTVGVRVTRDASGNWALAVDGTGGTNYVQEATGTNVTLTSSAHLGVQCVYTVSNANKFFYDDFYAGPQIVDNTPPALISATANSAVQVDLVFDEAVTAATAGLASNYAITPAITISSATVLSPNTVRLDLATSLTSAVQYTVTVNGVADPAGNITMNASTMFQWTAVVPPQPGDVVINEIMADPTPAVGLPETEFVELYNRTSDRTFDLAGWKFSDGGTPATLPSYVLAPNSFVLLSTATGAALFTTLPNKIGVTGFPALNNDGDPLTLSSPDNTLIDGASYSLAWYHDLVKAAGGWTLERIDPTTECSSAANWTASMAAQGGTPGVQNSVFAIVPDVQAPSLISVLVESPSQIELVFSEAMDAPSLISGSYLIAPSIGIQLVSVIDVQHVLITLSTELTIGTSYTVTVTGVSDCPGNAIGIPNTSTFALPEPVAVGDVVINEVLYDPIGSGSDFVELYNRSNKVLTLSGWKLANVTAGAVTNATEITTAAVLLAPGQYMLITEDAANIASNYPRSHTDRFLEADMPSYNNGSGTVVLLSPTNDTLDLFNYNDDLHFELLNSTDGVSLERIDPERPTSDNSNWHSASQDAGFATPGYQNSEYSPTDNANGALSIEPAIFSPDNDGYQDVLTIAYHFDEPGFVGTMKIFDIAGREVRTLLNNELLGTNGAVSWNGISDTQDLARMGPYVVYFEAFDLEGNVEKFRKSVVLAHRLN